MSFAFPAVFIFLLCLPGILFRHGYLVGTWFGPTRFKTVIEELSLGLIYSIVLHILWTCIWTNHLGTTISFDILVNLMAGTKSESNSTYNISQAGLLKFGQYIISLYLFSFLGGVILQIIVRSSRLDRIFEFIAPHSDTYYLMRGEVTFENISPELIAKITTDNSQPFNRWDLLGVIHKIPDPDIIIASAVVEMNGKAYIYMGYVNTWRLNSNGEIDKLVLSTTFRRQLENDTDKTKTSQNGNPIIEATSRDEFYRIDGSNFIIRGNEAKTLNLQYLWLEKKPSAEGIEQKHKVI